LLKEYDWTNVDILVNDIVLCWKRKKRVFLCGNGGSASNANHLANDLLYGASPGNGNGVNAVSLSSNASVMTCISNDISYDEVFSYQLSVMAGKGDLLIVFSGSGNSRNILKAIEKGRKIGMKTFGILGYSGGRAKRLLDVPIHFKINDMQIAEDCQQIVGHMIMKRIFDKIKMC